MSRFDEATNRRNTNSLKWHVGENELPLWVADMDFKTAPAIIEAIQNKTKEGIFGYEILPEEWFLAYQNWWKKRHHFLIEKKWLIFCTGVIPAITSAVKRMTSVGDNVLIQTPVYNIFFNSILNTGRHVLESPLIYENGEYRIDFAALEEDMKNPLTTMMILCNPHNPIGKIWDRDDLEKIGILAEKHHVIVLSDEIHCDLTDPQTEYIPFAAVNERNRRISITCLAPSKTFNIAGLHTAAVVIADEAIREKMFRALNSDEIAENGSFAVEGAIAAFTKGEEWLEELRQYLYENKTYVRKFIAEKIPELQVVYGQATYLLWLDTSAMTKDGAALAHFIRSKTGLYLSDGAVYGKAGMAFMRMNIACQRTTLADALERLKKGVELYGESLQ